jgi:hypothetical protein
MMACGHCRHSLNGCYGISGPLADLASLHLDVSRLDHFGPFFGVFNDDLSEIRKLANRHLQRYTARGPLARKKRFLERLFWTNDVADAAKKLALGSVQTGIDGSGGTDARSQWRGVSPCASRRRPSEHGAAAKVDGRLRQCLLLVATHRGLKDHSRRQLKAALFGGDFQRERKNEIGSCRSHAADCRGNSRRCAAIPVVARICRCNKPTSATQCGFGEYGNRRHLHVHRNPCS